MRSSPPQRSRRDEQAGVRNATRNECIVEAVPDATTPRPRCRRAQESPLRPPPMSTIIVPCARRRVSAPMAAPRPDQRDAAHRRRARFLDRVPLDVGCPARHAENDVRVTQATRRRRANEIAGTGRHVEVRDHPGQRRSRGCAPAFRSCGAPLRQPRGLGRSPRRSRRRKARRQQSRRRERRRGCSQCQDRSRARDPAGNAVVPLTLPQQYRPAPESYARQVITCPSCGAENPGGFSFCGSCGAALVEALPEREVRKTRGALLDVVTDRAGSVLGAAGG